MIRRLLAVTHEATITGAPMNLLHLVDWIGRHTDIETHVVILRDGPLRFRFEQLCDVTVVDDSGLAGLLAAGEQGLRQLGSRRARRVLASVRLRPRLRRLGGYDVLYLNSLESLGVLPYVPTGGVVVSHVHELQVATRTQPADRRAVLVDGPDAWIAASGAVADMLINELELPADRVLLHHEYIDAVRIGQHRPNLRDIRQKRRELGIHPDAMVVMGAGTIDWRKGADLFIQLASEVRRRLREPVAFVWVGGDLGGVDMQRLKSDAERAGADHVYFVGTKPEPLPWFDLADVFALTSHEDPFPLVCLEHAALGHPIVTYRNGGIPELLTAAGPEAALGIVDFLDVGALAERTIDLLTSTELYRRAAHQLRQEVTSRHDVDIAAPALMADLERLDDARRR